MNQGTSPPWGTLVTSQPLSRSGSFHFSLAWPSSLSLKQLCYVAFRARGEAEVLEIRVRAIWVSLVCPHRCFSSTLKTVFLLHYFSMECRCSETLEQLQDSLILYPLHGWALRLLSHVPMILPWCLHLFSNSLRLMRCCRQKVAAVQPVLFKLCPASKIKLNLIQNAQQNAVRLQAWASCCAAKLVCVGSSRPTKVSPNLTLGCG